MLRLFAEDTDVTPYPGMEKVIRESYFMMTIAAGGQLSTQVFVPCDVVSGCNAISHVGVVVRCKRLPHVVQDDVDSEMQKKYQLPLLQSTVGRWAKVDVDQLIAVAIWLDGQAHQIGPPPLPTPRR